MSGQLTEKDASTESQSWNIQAKERGREGSMACPQIDPLVPIPPKPGGKGHRTKTSGFQCRVRHVASSNGSARGLDLKAGSPALPRGAQERPLPPA